MAAYSAVLSLQNTINGLLNSPSSVSVSVSVSSGREILELAYKEASSLQEVLEGLNGSNRSRSSMVLVDDLEGQVRDSAHKLEDVLEFHELKLLGEEEGDEGATEQEIRSFGEAAKRMGKEYLAELSRDESYYDNEDTATNASSDIDFGVEMIGRSHLFDTVLLKVLCRVSPERHVYVHVGEQGSGSRLTVKTVFENGRRAGKLERWGWVKAGREHEVKDVLMSLIAQVEPDHHALLTADATEQGLSKYLYKALENQSYMIVLDGLDGVELLKHLLTTSFPDQDNGSSVHVTTISPEVLPFADVLLNYQLPDINEQFWLHMRQGLLGSDSIPGELEVAGKQILRNCGLLIISIARTVDFLSKSDKTVEQWSNLAADKDNPIFRVVDELSEGDDIQKEVAVMEMNFPSRVTDLNLSMYPERFFSKVQIISFFGMQGIGKTTFAGNIFRDDSTSRHFNYRVWIPMGPRYQTENILIDILAQICPQIPKLHIKGNEELVAELCVQLSNMRILIVLDELCSQDPLHHLREIFPTIKGTILVTTRQPKVAEFGRDDTAIEMQLLGEEESWCLLSRKVFNGGLCPPELEKAGRKIAEKCDGHPLLILKVAERLRTRDQSQEYWNNVASGKEKSVFLIAHYQISQALLPSYNNLPQHLKPCFLYLGVFLQRHDISTSEFSTLLISEGFLKPAFSQTEEDFVARCLLELFDVSLVMVQRNVSGSTITRCRLHSIFWHLCNTQAAKSKLFHPMNSYDDCSIESVERHRRLCIRDGILLSIKDVQESMASNAGVRSIICVGPFHQHPVPLNFDLRLLRVMNALTIRLFEFPTEVTSLFHLRYLSLTCNGQLPASISKLQKLQCLIVKRYMNIISVKNSSYLPLEIWDMKELKHLQIMGGRLPGYRHGCGLLKLSALLDVSVESCREEVLKWIPNLKRLGIRIELAPTDESHCLPNMNDIYHLHKLESLKCVVVNPQIGNKNVPPPTFLSLLPPGLKKLSLSGLGYAWKHMSAIGKLKNLEVLKLKCYAFEGPNWEMDSTHEFEKLKFLVLEDTNLVKWKSIGQTNLVVERVCIKHCYKLQELPLLLSAHDTFKKLEMADCTPSAVTKAEKLKRWLARGEISTHSSWLAVRVTRQE